MLKELTDDIDNGADSGDVLDAIRSSLLLHQVTVTLDALAAARTEDGARSDARLLHEAVIHTSSAAQVLDTDRR